MSCRSQKPPEMGGFLVDQQKLPSKIKSPEGLRQVEEVRQEAVA